MLQMEECLIRRSSSDLVSVLHYEGLTSFTLTRLDRLVTKDLCGSGFSRVVVVLKSLEILSENKDDLQQLLDNGLTAKVVSWFEAVHNLLTSDIQNSSSPLLTLAEEFYDYFLLLGQTSLPVTQLSVVLLQLTRFALETEIHFPLRLEAIRTFNSILESLSREQRKQIQKDPNLIQILFQIAASVLTVGDYELQVSLSEALCRLTPRKERPARANQWFSSRDVTKAFCDIKDADFEVDCRSFLNFVNNYQGDKRRVFTFPCRKAFLDSTELFRPKDEKLDDFWIDFNVSSECVSFFIDEPQGFLWDSVHLIDREVDRFSLDLNPDGPESVLSVHLLRAVSHQQRKGHDVKLMFSCEHHRDLEEAARRVFKTVGRTPDGLVQSPPSANQSSRCYGRKKQQSKSQLKILPLSSDDEDPTVVKTPVRNRSEILFDLIKTSTPKNQQGVSEVQSPQVKQFAGSSSKDVVCLDRKRTLADSGYLSDHTEDLPAHKRKVETHSPYKVSSPEMFAEEDVSSTHDEEGHPQGEELQPEEEEPQPEGEELHTEEEELQPEEEELQPEEEEPQPEGEELHTEEEELQPEGEGPMSQPDPDIITAAIKAFRTQLEQHFTGGWKTVESEVLLSLRECQQHVSTLLTAVHQQRLALLQGFENSITDHLKRLQEQSTSLNNMNTQIQSFLRSEMQKLGSFCDELLQRLNSLESGESSQ